MEGTSPFWDLSVDGYQNFTYLYAPAPGSRCAPAAKRIDANNFAL